MSTPTTSVILRFLDNARPSKPRTFVGGIPRTGELVVVDGLDFVVAEVWWEEGDDHNRPTLYLKWREK